MGKRTASEANPRADQDDRYQKRQRIQNFQDQKPTPPPVPAAEEVSSARQLQRSLVFEQGAAAALRSGLNLFKKFLDSILYSGREHDLPRKRAILREYLDSQKRNGREGKDTEFLPTFIQAWDYAAETNFEALLSQVTANLALLLKVLSSDSQFQDYGVLLCKTVLQPSIARRLNRSLSAAPTKENVISPVLRLLTEIVSFNEGAQAKSVYARRDFTLEPKILGRNLGLRKESTGDKDLDQRKPGVRNNAVRYLLTHLKYQDELVKTEILSNWNIVRALLDHLHSDPPSLIVEILDVMKNHVFLDKTIQRQIKSRILTERTLSNIAGLYRYQVAEDFISEGQKNPDAAAHEFLVLVCTSPAFGVMLPSNGFYVPANEEDDMDVIMDDSAEFAMDLGFGISDDSDKKRRIRNVILGEFIQSLRPYANILQQELLLAIFQACPELVADYFLRKEAFHYEPKLTSTWIGYSSFLYQTVELPVPPHLGIRRGYRGYPPSISVVIQSVLPQPLNQQVLTKCLNHSSDLVNFFAIRVLIVAFHKLRAILQEFKNAALSRSSKSWEQASKRLVTEFCQRCPQMKTVILAFRRPSFQKGMMREAITRLLRLYYEITPQVALQEKFDVSIPLCNALTKAEQPADAAEDKALRILELEHWAQIARHSPAMRWWQKPKTLQHSPFMTLLKLVATSTSGESYSGIQSLIVSILRDHDMLQTETFPTALDVLIASLGTSYGSSPPPPQVLDFLDDCCARFVKGPIKYFDDLDAMCGRLPRSESTLGPVSPLLMTLVEQWPFKGSETSKENPAEPLAHWLSKFLYLLKLIGEDETLLERVRDSLVTSADKAYQEVLKDSFLWKMAKEKAKDVLKLATGADFSGSERASSSPIPEPPNDATKDASMIDLELPPEEHEKHTGLNRWRKKDIDENIEDGNIGELLLCLCSKHAEIRLQAAINIRQLMAKVEASKNPDFLQLKLLLGEALETAQHTLDNNPLPYVGGVFAARAVNVLTDPTHFLFGKVNKFLMKRPSWTVENLPRYFGRNILANEPEEDNSYHKEVDWLLDYFIDCLRTAEDLEIFRTRNIFERLLSYYSSVTCAISAKEKIVRLLFRAAAVGGSTTLITRCGLLSWIQMRLENNDHRHHLLRQLVSRLYDACDKEKVDEWSSGKAKETVALVEKTKAGRF
ncbi:hypothetical protein K469DRAFT_661021 [Zopfia rhizophila CBS 207.26]|uniref:Ribosome biogenesis protein Urb1 n=1 Tax=Zopfia rhizophila CBS 207.26 TaxID=1314779 RepID=A0A6A6EEL1_9PEZI|nr:hypothetical protein K469DRAFT_661021 [Zopfia rhizophila CBS 207.26]